MAKQCNLYSCSALGTITTHITHWNLRQSGQIPGIMQHAVSSPEMLLIFFALSFLQSPEPVKCHECQETCYCWCWHSCLCSFSRCSGVLNPPSFLSRPFVRLLITPGMIIPRSSLGCLLLCLSRHASVIKPSFLFQLDFTILRKRKRWPGDGAQNSGHRRHRRRCRTEHAHFLLAMSHTASRVEYKSHDEIMISTMSFSPLSSSCFPIFSAWFFAFCPPRSFTLCLHRKMK